MATIQDVNIEIDRIQLAEAAIKSAIAEKGVEIPQGARIEDLANLILQIATMDPNDYYTKNDLEQMAETWTFELDNNTTVTKKVIILPE